MKRWFPLFALVACTSTAFPQARKDKKPEPTFSLKSFLVIPSHVEDNVFGDLTETVAAGDLMVQQPLFKGLGVGAGVRGSYFQFNERVLLGVASGDVTRWTYFGKIQYEHYTGPTTFYEFSARFGQSSYRWNSSSCPDVTVRSVFHWSIAASYFIHATDNLAFGLMLGYEQDMETMDPSVICADEFPVGVGDGSTGPIRLLNIGLGFSTRFQKAEDRPLY